MGFGDKKPEAESNGIPIWKITGIKNNYFVETKKGIETT